MPERSTVQRANTKQRQGKAPSTQAGEFVKEEMHHIREGKHGARSTKQAIAIGLSKARRAGVDLKPPRKGKTSASTRRNAERDYQKGQAGGAPKPSPRRSKATLPHSNAKAGRLLPQPRSPNRRELPAEGVPDDDLPPPAQGHVGHAERNGAGHL